MTTSPLDLFGNTEPLLFGVTPPRVSTTPEQLSRTVEATLERVNSLSIDALALYDIEDESDRNPDARPFPFVRTIDPASYLTEQLSDWQGRAVVYRSVGKYSPAELSGWITSAPDNALTVFVGASSSTQPVATTLSQAHQLRARLRPGLPLGAVALPERHRAKRDEHLRMVAKQTVGASFFVTQVVYDRSGARDMVSDYVYHCRDRGVTPAPILFTLSVCGSPKTLDFLEWLGVEVPRWLRNELTRSNDMLRMSVTQATSAATELAQFCRHLGAPFGFNIESVSSRRVEIDAAVELTDYVASQVLHRG